MTDQRRRGEAEAVEQLAVINGEIVPVLELMHGIRRALAGAEKFRCVNGEVLGELRNEPAISIEAPWPMQINERRAFAADLDLGLDAVLPKLQPAYLDAAHDAAAMAGAGR